MESGFHPHERQEIYSNGCRSSAAEAVSASHYALVSCANRRKSRKRAAIAYGVRFGPSRFLGVVHFGAAEGNTSEQTQLRCYDHKSLRRSSFGPCGSKAGSRKVLPSSEPRRFLRSPTEPQAHPRIRPKSSCSPANKERKCTAIYALGLISVLPDKEGKPYAPANRSGCSFHG